jgi:DUF2905 family protein
MRAPNWVIFLSIVILGALVLSPVVAQLGIHPLPGDLTFNWGTHKVFLPLAQSVIASIVLGLLFLWARK